jgi:hypothetical protein
MGGLPQKMMKEALGAINVGLILFPRNKKLIDIFKLSLPLNHESLNGYD